MEINAPNLRLCRAAIALLAVLVWFGNIKNAFVWDDHFFIMDNQAIRSLDNIPAMFYSRIAEGAATAPFPNFRPLRNVVYAVLYKMGGKDIPQPWIFHLANILGHAAAALLLFSTALLLFQAAGAARSAWAALLTACAFAVHPAASEVVCWAKSLDDIMAAIFVLASARQLLLWQGERRRLVIALVFFVLAMYSKESAVPFAGLVFFVWRVCHKLPWKRCAMLTLPFLAAAAVYVAHRQLVLGSTAQCAPLSGSYGQTLVDTLPAVAIYFRLLWGIPPFSVDYSDMPAHRPLLSMAVMGGAGLLLMWAAVTWAAWRREKYRIAALGLLWLALFLAPVSNLLPMLQYAAERFLYLSLIGWLLACGAVIAWRARRMADFGMASLILAIWIPLCLTRQAVWRDEVTLFVSSSLAQPKNVRLRGNAVASIFRLPEIHSAFNVDQTGKHLTAPLSIPREQGEEMLPTLRRAHQLLPNEHFLTEALAISYGMAGQISNAIPLLELAARQNSNDVQRWIDLGSVYGLEHETHKARQAWETARSLDPTNRLVLERLHALEGKD